MLISDQDLLSCPVLSLQTGKKLATTAYPVINPQDLSLIAFELEGSLLEKSQSSFLLTEDIREYSDIGLIINSSDELVLESDIVYLQQVLKLDFDLIDLPVYSKDQTYLGKVKGFYVVYGIFLIYQLVIARPWLKSFVDSELIINRQDIVDVKSDKIIVKNAVQKNKEKASYKKEVDFINPFRQKKGPIANNSQK